jgi:hypothetical protein
MGSSEASIGVACEGRGQISKQQILEFPSWWSSLVTNKEYVNIHRSYCDEATAEHQQFFSVEVQDIGTFDCLLKKHKKSWRRDKHNQCFFHPTNDEDKAADYHKTDEIRIFYYLQHVNACEDLIKPQKIQILYC